MAIKKIITYVDTETDRRYTNTEDVHSFIGEDNEHNTYIGFFDYASCTFKVFMNDSAEIYLDTIQATDANDSPVTFDELERELTDRVDNSFKLTQIFTDYSAFKSLESLA